MNTAVCVVVVQGRCPREAGPVGKRRFKPAAATACAPPSAASAGSRGRTVWAASAGLAASRQWHNCARRPTRGRRTAKRPERSCRREASRREKRDGRRDGRRGGRRDGRRGERRDGRRDARPLQGGHRATAAHRVSHSKLLWMPSERGSRGDRALSQFRAPIWAPRPLTAGGPPVRPRGSPRDPCGQPTPLPSTAANAAPGAAPAAPAGSGTRHGAGCRWRRARPRPPQLP